MIFRIRGLSLPLHVDQRHRQGLEERQVLKLKLHFAPFGSHFQSSGNDAVRKRPRFLVTPPFRKTDKIRKRRRLFFILTGNFVKKVKNDKLRHLKISFRDPYSKSAHLISQYARFWVQILQKKKATSSDPLQNSNKTHRPLNPNTNWLRYMDALGWEEVFSNCFQESRFKYKKCTT